MEMKLHYSDDLIEDYSRGRLAEDQSSAFEEHLLMCAECQTRLAQFDEYRVVARTAFTSSAENARPSLPHEWVM